MEEKDYKVGYRKPPEEHRFRKGKSGNPKGRPKKPPRSGIDAFQYEMERMITVMEGGVRMKIPVHQALFRALIASGLKGNYKACHTALREYQALLVSLQPRHPQEYIISFEGDGNHIPSGHVPAAYTGAREGEDGA